MYDAYSKILDIFILAKEELIIIDSYADKYVLDMISKVNIQVINCSLNNDSTDVQYRSTIQQKFNALLSAEAKALLIVCDAESFEFVQEIDDDIIYGEPVQLSDKLYDACRIEDGYSYMPEDIMICCRSIDGKNISREKHIKAYFKESQKIMKALQSELDEQIASQEQAESTTK